MKKYIGLVLVGILFVPLVSLASIDKNLSYGSRGSQVTELQEFLIDQNFLQGTATGNFFSLTLKAVKAFQSAHNIPSTGYVGMLSRSEINSELASALSSSTQEQVAETGTTTAPTSTSPILSALQQQNAILQQQLQAQQQTNTILQNQQQTTTQQPQPTPTPAPVTPPQVSINSAFTDQYLAPNTANVRIGSYIIQAGSSGGSSATDIVLKLNSSVGLKNLAHLRVVESGNTLWGGGSGSVSTSTIELGNPNNSGQIDVWSDVGSATGTISTSLVITGPSIANGVTTNSTTIQGQNITIANGQLVAPTVVSATSSQIVYNFVSNYGYSVVQELKFSVGGLASSAVSSVAVTVNGITASAPVISGVADINGMSIPVPVGSSGTNVFVAPTYQSSLSGNTATIALTYAKSLSALSTTILNNLNVSTDITIPVTTTN